MSDTDWRVEYDRAIRLGEEALTLVHERDVVVVTLAAGWHPFEGVGLELSEQLLNDLKAGTIIPPITQEMVWSRAEAAGYLPDFTPVFRPRTSPPKEEP